MPLPKSSVIPAGWSDHHRPTATSTMTSVCDVTRAGTGEGTYNPGTGQTTPPAGTTVQLDVPCRIQAEIRDYVVDAGDEPVSFHRYLVTLPYDVAQVLVDDLVTVTASEDAQLVGKSLRVRDVLFGSLQWERDLRCEMNEG